MSIKPYNQLRIRAAYGLHTLLVENLKNICTGSMSRSFDRFVQIRMLAFSDLTSLKVSANKAMILPASL